MIYELHVRGFTKTHPEVPAELRPLLTVSLDLSDPLAPVGAAARKAAIAAALRTALPKWPRLRIDVEGLDWGSAHLFARSYNRARQGQITSELLEIIGGAEALNG